MKTLDRPGLDQPDAQMYHVRKRVRERYGIDLGKPAYLHLGWLIQSGQALFIREADSGRQWFYVPYHDKMLKVLYDTATKRIATVFNDNSRA